jgi:uncharacterized membrane protein YcaP (DUF421 family)
MEEWMIILLRTAVLFILLLLLYPILGRKPLSGMTLFDYTVFLVAAVMIGLISLNVVQNLAHGLIALIVWLVGVMAVQFLILKSKWAHDHFYGKEMVMIKQGKVMEENLKSARLTGEELLSQLRRRNIFKIADVEFAVMESNGDITAMLKRDKQPVTPKDLNLSTGSSAEPQTVILDGNILDEPLAVRGLTKEWLTNELNKKGISAENIFLGQVDAEGELAIDLFDDTIQLPRSTTKQQLLSTLKKSEADLSSFALETDNQYWKENYSTYAKTVRDVYDKLQPKLK